MNPSEIEIDARELQLSFSRSSGPGGQNVNKVASKVTMKWNVNESTCVTEPVKKRFMERFANRINDLGECVIISDRFRDQPKNIADCKHKLSEMLMSVAKPPKVRRPTKPSKAKVRARLDRKREQSEKKRMRRKPGMSGH